MKYILINRKTILGTCIDDASDLGNELCIFNIWERCRLRVAFKQFHKDDFDI